MTDRAKALRKARETAQARKDQGATAAELHETALQLASYGDVEVAGEVIKVADQ
ncbi:hypothetical protein [Nonomuraea salmonea]|uniref:Uncharacterized protein n=1 Tax=Nonomuraea salmonea TaxID=46181 RepID=A0ABV5P3D2_9ACTN